MSRQRGAALIVALLIVATVVTLVVSLASDFLVPLKRTENLIHEQQALSYLLTTEGVARQVLLADMASSTLDGASELWATEQLQFPTPQGLIVATLRDLQGLINLNQLNYNPATNSPRPYSAQQERFIRLLQVLPLDQPLTFDEAQPLANAVFDWLDADDTERIPGGAESYQYSALEPPVRMPQGGQIKDVSELRWVSGMTDEIYTALKPYVSVWPDRNGGLNVNTAPFEILRCLNATGVYLPLTEVEVEQILEERTTAGAFEDMGIFNTGALQGMQIDTTGLTTASNYFELDASTEFLGRIFYLTSTFNRNAQANSIRLVARNQSR